MIEAHRHEQIRLLLDKMLKLKIPVLYKGQIAIIQAFNVKTNEDTFIEVLETDTGSITSISDIETNVTIVTIKNKEIIENVSMEELTLYFPKLHNT